MDRPLDDETKREALLRAVEGGATVPEASDSIGVSDRTVQRYAGKHAEFAAKLAASLIRRTQLKHQTTPPDRAPELPPPAVAAGVLPERVEPVVPPPEPPDPPGLWTRDQYLERLQGVADDDEHPACGTALRLLGGWHIEAPIAAKRKIAERAAEDTGDGGTVTRYAVALPEPDSGPGVDHEPDVIDAEIVEDE